MKKLLIVMLSAICIVACITGLAACNSNTYRGTYYSGYPNDASSDKLVISRSHASSGSTEFTYKYNDNTITLSTGVQICFAEGNQVAYFPIAKWSSKGNIPTRNGYFSAQLTYFSNYQLVNSYQFHNDGTFRFVNVQSAKILTGTYYLKNGVLSTVVKNENGSNGYVSLNQLHFWYIDQNYNIFFGALVKDYTKFQKTDNENMGGNDVDLDNVPDPVIKNKVNVYFSSPVNYTSVSMEYTDGKDTLFVFSSTLNEWVTHLGVDLAAADGTDVNAMYDGTIIDVKETFAMGNIVTIDHGDNVVATYASLSDVQVIKGQAVKKGDKIGSVSTTASNELMDGAHLHLEVAVNGTNVDPMPYVRGEVFREFEQD